MDINEFENRMFNELIKVKMDSNESLYLIDFETMLRDLFLNRRINTFNMNDDLHDKFSETLIILRLIESKDPQKYFCFYNLVTKYFDDMKEDLGDETIGFYFHSYLKSKNKKHKIHL